jgi:hypothetical protein
MLASDEHQAPASPRSAPASLLQPCKSSGGAITAPVHARRERLPRRCGSRSRTALPAADVGRAETVTRTLGSLRRFAPSTTSRKCDGGSRRGPARSTRGSAAGPVRGCDVAEPALDPVDADLVEARAVGAVELRPVQVEEVADRGELEMYGIPAVRAAWPHLGRPRLILTSVTAGGSASSAARRYHVNRRPSGTRAVSRTCPFSQLRSQWPCGGPSRRRSEGA